MKILGEMNDKVRVLEHVWIPLPDGTRLAAKIWLPAEETAGSRPVPAIVEYLPYRKRDGTDARDSAMHPYLAAHGYACVRIDIRGSGESEGLFDDEYSPRELADGKAAIEWIADQAWCDGNVGIMGISWGGFNGLQIGALRPEPLKAIVTICSTDDRYADDIHYMGGCLLNDNMTWSSVMLGELSLPPDPMLVGDDWREIWLNRLENMPLLARIWLDHQTRDAYWKHASVCENHADISAPVLAVGGWADAYTNAIPRLLAGLSCPARGLIGPWVHKYPHLAYPKPDIGFLQETLRWWDHWLKGIDTGVMAEPLLRAFIIEDMPARAHHDAVKGRWVGETDWPSPSIKPRVFGLSHDGDAVAGRLLENTPGSGRVDILSPQTLGADAGSFCPGMRIGTEYPDDQRQEDALSACFDSKPLETDLELLGAPILELDIASDKPVSKLVARLCDIHPDGGSTRVSYMPFNLTQRNSREFPEPLRPGERYTVRIQLSDLGYRFRAGHRIRLALSNAYWPIIWPSPARETVTIDLSSARLSLPERMPRDDDGAFEFGPAEAAQPSAREELRPASHERTVSRDVVTGRVTVRTTDDFGTSRFMSHGLETGGSVDQIYSIEPDDPLSAEAVATWRVTSGRGDWQTRVDTTTRMWSSESAFFLRTTLQAFEGEKLVHEREWNESVPRNCQ